MKAPTIKQLLNEYNRLASRQGKPGLSSWKQAKASLAARVATLRTAESGTIRARVEELLTEVVETDEASGSRLGVPYDEVVLRLRATHPHARTTARTLAWHASDLRSRGVDVPLRPRSARRSG